MKKSKAQATSVNDLAEEAFVNFECRMKLLNQDADVRCFCGDIRTYQNDECDETTKIGRVTGFLVSSELMDNGESFDACDAESQALHDAHATLFYENDIRPEIVDAIGEPTDRGWVYVESIRVEKAYRGHGLGLLALMSVIDLFEAGVILCKPCPLDRTAGEPLDPSQVNGLERYWKRAGFTTIRGADGMKWLVLNTANRRPTAREVIEGWSRRKRKAKKRK